jgi:glycosyltransferase involved in cell wall biosynthesis
LEKIAGALPRRRYDVMKFIVTQIGARRGYAVPAILERAGMLERFYTDLCADAGLGRWLVRAGKIPLLNGRMAKLAGRRLPENVRAKTTTFGGSSVVQALLAATAGRDPQQRFRAAMRTDAALGTAMTRQGFGEATHLYSMLGEARPFLDAAQQQGLIVVMEIYILLATEKILAAERKQFPDWEDSSPDHAAVREEFAANKLPLRACDFAICPSEAVRDDLVANFEVKPEQCAVVPYGMNPELLNVRSEPVPGRVLFAGTADLRKGIHYFAMAAERLSQKVTSTVLCPLSSDSSPSSSGHRYEFRVAGNVTPRVRQQPVCRHLNFLGRIPRAEMAREFAIADVFVLPSLAEGSAEVTYEALACGLPVITTQAAGSVVRDGIEGRIVPERDPVALAEAIREVVEDREKRDRMAHAARVRARDYTWERYGGRLVTALQAMNG